MKFLSKKQNGIFITVILMAIISTMMATALSSALPAIMTDFKISAGSAQWVTSLYSLVSGIMILITAFIIKRFPTRKIFLINVGSFTLGSLISALASNFIILIIGRIFQGIGNGLVLALTQVIILKIFPADRQGFGMGLYGLAIGLTPVIAPLIAGILIDVGSWRLIFYVVIVICIVDLILAFIFLDNILDQEKSSFDISSMIYAALAFTGIIYGLGNIGNFKFFNLQTGGSLLVGLIFLFIFLYKTATYESTVA
ncbi:MFS transporter [Companilactobacillus farciminis]|nr:MFS transporter [Companilactobacillus farciminis]